MADVLNSDAMADHVHATQNDLGKNRWINIAPRLQSYEFMKHIAKDDKIVMGDGKGISRNANITTGNHARSVGHYQVITRNQAPTLDQMRIPWRKAFSYWDYDYSEMLQNKGESRVTNIIEPRSANAWLDMADHLETVGWVSPAATNIDDPYGIPYYVVQNVTEGFNGGNPSGYSDCAGIDSDVVAAWKNWTGTYTEVTKSGLVFSMRRGHRKLNWVTPVTSKEVEFAQDLRVYTTSETVEAFEVVGENQNENIGRDIGAMQAGGRDIGYPDGTISFRRHPIIYVPQLDESTSNNPVYLLDMSTFAMYCLKGNYMRVEKPKTSVEQPSVWVTDMFLEYNFLMQDRRRNAVWYKV